MTSRTVALPAARPLGRLPRVSLSARARTRVGHGAIAVLLLAGATLAVGAASSPSTEVPVSYLGFPGWLAGPLPDVDLKLGPARFVPLIVVMALAHGVALAVWSSLSTRVVLGAVVGAHVLFTLAPPILSPDVFGYLAYARMDVLYGLNPYVNLPEIPSDDVVRLHPLARAAQPVRTAVHGAHLPRRVPGRGRRAVDAQGRHRPGVARPGGAGVVERAPARDRPRRSRRCSSGSTRSCSPTPWAERTTTC